MRALVLLLALGVAVGCRSTTAYEKGGPPSGDSFYKRCESRGGIPLYGYREDREEKQLICLSPDALR